MSQRSSLSHRVQPHDKRSRKKRTYNTRRIRREFGYTVHEIGELYDVHPNAVRRWIRSGLPTIDGLRPALVHGSELIAFLDERQTSRKRKCQPDEFYCFRCRSPRRARRNRVEIEIKNDRQLNLAGVCAVCGARINRIGSVLRLSDYRNTFIVERLVDRRITERSDPGVMCHFDEETENAELQPQE